MEQTCIDAAGADAADAATSTDLIAALVAAAPPGEATPGRKPLDAKDEEGLLFVNRDGTLSGALRFEGELFKCAARPVRAASGSSWLALHSSGDRGDAVTGCLFVERGGVTPEGRFRPRLTGRVSTVAGRRSRRVAAWVRASPKAPFYSVRLTPLSDPGEGLQLSLQFPLAGSMGGRLETA